MVYTDARAYPVHVIFTRADSSYYCPCICYACSLMCVFLDVVSYSYVFTCSLLPGMTFNLFTLFLMHFILLPNLAILIPQTCLVIINDKLL